MSLDIFFGNALNVASLRMGTVDNLIINIREILDEGNFRYLLMTSKTIAERA